MMVCSPFTNYCFQMGVTVMGFAEHFGLNLVWRALESNGDIGPQSLGIWFMK